ncbi:MAG: hypothetical protein H8E84_07945 [Flavobacteriales bacterium]|nr:hypothetical protein [Flavobacteriales bacterium]
MKKNKDSKERNNLGLYMALGSALGVSLGVSFGTYFDNVGIGIGIGVAIGTGIGLLFWSVMQAKKLKKDCCNNDTNIQELPPEK